MFNHGIPLMLATSIALAIAGNSPAAAAESGDVSVQIAPISTGPALVDLREAYSILSTANQPGTRQLLASRVLNSTLPTSESTGGSQVVIVDARSLANEEVFNQSRTLFEQGTPIAIYRSPQSRGDDDDLIMRLFGAASESDMTVYTKGDQGVLRSFSTDIDHSLAYPDTAARVARMNQDIELHLAGGAESKPMATGTDFPENVPIVEIVDTLYGADGNAITLTMSVARDSAPSRDDFVAVVKSSSTLMNPQRSMITKSWTNAAHRYLVKHDFVATVPAGNDWIQTISEHRFPGSTGRTKINVSEKKTTSTSFGLNLSADHLVGLSKVPSSTVKPSFGFNLGAQNSKESGISFQVNDYYLESGANIMSDSWEFRLADEMYRSMKKGGSATPAMKSIAPELLSVRRIKAARAGKLGLKANVLMATIAVDNVEGTMIPLLRTRYYWVDLTSPYLTREPTVLLQTKSNDGKCLISQGTDRATVGLGPCDTRPSNLAAQWYLDPDSRYVSRLDGRCLTLSATGSQEVKLATCGHGGDQKWYWAADRIQSDYDGGRRGWRLFVASSSVKARINPSTQQLIPVNPNQILLNPWSTYPRAPVAGTTVPTLSGPESEVPAAWIGTIRDVPSSDRWTPITIRQFRQ